MSDTCAAPFEFFLRVATICGRPKGHAGDHHPVALAQDASTSSPRADVAPRGEDAHPDSSTVGGRSGSGCAPSS